MFKFWWVCLSSDKGDVHVLVQNELVKSRLRNEEMEEELVRYKLLSVAIQMCFASAF